MFPKAQLDALKQFIDLVNAKPELLHLDELKFFKDFIEKFGGQIPVGKASEAKPETAKPEPEPEPELEPVPEEPEEEEEPEIHEDDPDIWEAGDDVEPIHIDQSKEVPEDAMDRSLELKHEGMELQNEGDFDGAIKKYSEAIDLNPNMAMLYASRALCYMKMKKAKAAIADCTAGISLNPNSAKAYKVRGKAYRHLGDFEKAATDLRLGQQLDFDEDTADLHKFIEEKAKKIFEKKRKASIRARERAEKEAEAALRRRQQELKKQRERELEEEREEQRKAAAGAGGFGGMGGMPGFGGTGGMGGMPGMGGMGGMPGMGGVPPEMMQQMFSDPEVMAAMQDPEVQALLPKLMKGDPSAIAAMQSNPKLAKLMGKLGGMFGASAPGAGAGCGPGGCGGHSHSHFPGAGTDVD